MKKPVFNYTVAAFVLMFSLNSNAQTIDSLLNNYTADYKQERLYLHYDKSSYTPGDTIWFKAYLMTELFPSEDSKTIYVDWLDEKGAVLEHTVAPVLEASSNGQFAVPEKYSGSTIYVKAYTRWMLNFDSSFLYNKQLSVLSKTPAPATQKNEPVVSVQFLPEGGDAVAGLKNKIAFKATDQWGQPANISGTIYDDKGKAIETFRSIHHGMGTFYLMPEAGVSYTAKWKISRGVQQETLLPAIKPAGVGITVSLAGSRRIVTVERSANAPAANLYMVGTMYQQKVFSTTVNLSTKNTESKNIPTQNLPTGILTITIFNAAHQPLAERITYIKNGNFSFQPEVNVVRYGLNKRAKNEWELIVPDSLAANLSIAVTDAAINSDSSENIYSHLLLTSELKGTIYKPAQYFLSNQDSINQQLDLVMLTNGWRRFNWTAVVGGRTAQIAHPRDTAYLHFSGKLYGIQPGRLSNENLVAILKPKDSAASQMLAVPINSNGVFSQPDFVFFDTLQVFYQFKKGSLLNGASARFMENRFGAPKWKALNFIPSNIFLKDTTGAYYQRARATEKLELKEFFNSKMLSNVTVRSQIRSRINELDKRYTSGLFSGADSYQFDLTEDRTAMSALNIFQYLQGKVAGLQISNSGASTTLQWRGGSPSVYLNEAPTDIDMISSVAVSDIAYVKVFRPPFMGGFNGAGGAIAIYTKRGNDAQNTSTVKGLDKSTIVGYSPVKEFYSPNYGTFDARHEQRDLRTTLYWNPFVITTPKNNKVKLAFYNNDVTKAFRVIIEGITKDGQLTHYETIIE